MSNHLSNQVSTMQWYYSALTKKSIATELWFHETKGTFSLNFPAAKIAWNGTVEKCSALLKIDSV